MGCCERMDESAALRQKLTGITAGLAIAVLAPVFAASRGRTAAETGGANAFAPRIITSLEERIE